MNYGNLPIHSPESIIAIPDIHGEYERLCRLEDCVIPVMLNPNTHLVFCGDYVNRKGESSPKVLEKLIELKNIYKERVFFIKGNHEEMLRLTLNRDFGWFKYTENTLKQMMLEWNIEPKEKPLSYISEIIEACKERGIIDFLDNLIPYYESTNTIITHAPIDKYTCELYALTPPFLDKMSWDLMWGNTEEKWEMDLEKYLICGHQYQNSKDPRILKTRAFLDTGCGCVLNRPLIAFQYPEKRVFRESY